MGGMSAISYKSGFYSPKRGGVPKYRNLNRNLVYAAYPAMGETGTTLFDTRGTMIEHAGSWVNSLGYPAVYNHGAVSLGSVYLPIAATKAPFSMFAWVVRTNASEAGILSQNIAAEANRMFFYVGNAVRYSNAAVGDLSSITASASGDMLTIVLSDDCVTARLYVNGKFEASQSGTGQCSNNPTLLDATRDLNLLGLCLWNGSALSQQDAVLLQSDPFAPLRLNRNRGCMAPTAATSRRNNMLMGCGF